MRRGDWVTLAVCVAVAVGLFCLMSDFQRCALGDVRCELLKGERP
jgi:hypothetical protein